jgi:hypothetical protein
VSSLVERAYGVDDYQPIDARARAEQYRTSRGVSEGWPIPLTRVGEPSVPASFRRAPWYRAAAA